jgi:pimeloyl-ACP methyl ester carboxylesterase
MLFHITVFMITLVGTGFAFSLGAEEVWERIQPPKPMPDAISSGYAPVNGVQIYYSIYGSGRPVILLHGGLGNMEYFGNQISAFAEEFEVIALDSRGHGRSSSSSQPYTCCLMASDVLAVMDYLGVPNASIVGWSDGAIIGLEMAIQYPERLDKLVAFGGNYNVSGLRSDIKKSSTFKLYCDLAQKDYKRLSSTPEKYSVFLAAMKTMWRTQPNYSPKQLASIRAPTLVIVGEYDEVIKRSHAREMAYLIPHSKLMILPGVSHFAMLQKPEDFNKAVLQFLEGE